MNVLDSIGQDIISKLSFRYPDVEFSLIEIRKDSNTIYFEYNSSVGYHECIGLHTDFSRLSDHQYYERIVTAIYDYTCELFDAEADDSYWDD